MRIDRELLRTTDWSKTSLGPMASWPRSLGSYVAMLLELPTPASIFWGPDHAQIYNDSYALIMGPRHPQHLGSAFEASWPEMFRLVGPWMDRILAEGGHFEVARAPLTNGFNEEAYFSFTLSPLRDDDDRIAGVYQPVVEQTESVLRERRAETLRRLTVRGEVLASAVEAFNANPNDVPIAAIFLRDDVEGRARRPQVAASTGFAADPERDLQLAPFHAIVARVLAENVAVETEGELRSRGFTAPVHKLFVTPIRGSASDLPLGVAFFGVSPRLRFDASYRELFEAIARELGTNLAAQREQEMEREWQARSALAAPVASSAADALRVLVVDDNEDAVTLLSEALGMLGYDTHVAYDGAGALALSARVSFDVALLDIGLPVMDGYELAARLRATPGGDRLHLVAITGYGQASDRRRTMEAGFDAHLVKPVELSCVAELLRSYAASRVDSRERPGPRDGGGHA